MAQPNGNPATKTARNALSTGFRQPDRTRMSSHQSLAAVAAMSEASYRWA